MKSEVLMQIQTAALRLVHSKIIAFGTTNVTGDHDSEIQLCK